MPKRRSVELKELPSRQCKKPKTLLTLREKRKIINYDDSKYDTPDSNDVCETKSERIELSSEDSKEKLSSVISEGNFESTGGSSVILLDSNEQGADEIKFQDIDYIEAGSKQTSAVSLSSDESVLVSRKKRRKGKKLTLNRSKPVEIFYVEKILDMKIENGKRKFLLKWEGFPDSENSWEPEENVGKNHMVQKFLKENHLNNSKIEIEIDSDSNSDKDKTISDTTVIDLVNTKENEIESVTNEIENVNEGENSNNSVEIIQQNSAEIIEGTPSQDEYKDIENTVEPGKQIEADVDDKGIEETDKSQNENNSAGNSKTIFLVEVDDDNDVREEKSCTQSQEDVSNDYTEIDENNENKIDDNINDADKTEDIKSQVDEKEIERVENEPLTKTVIKISKLKKKKARKKSKKKEIMQLKSHINQSQKEISESNTSSIQAADSAPAQTNGEGDADNNDVDSTKSNQKASNKDPNAYFPRNMPQNVQEIFMVEKILKMKIINGVRKFFLKWEGFPDSENTWEPEENLECPELIKEFLDEQKKKKKLKKKNPTPSEDSPELEMLPEDVMIKEPPVKPRGFPRSREAECILAAGMMHDQLMFLIKWKNVDMANLVTARRANIECPQIVIGYYENHLKWQNYDNTLTKMPYENLADDVVEPPEPAIESKKQSHLTETMENLISMVTEKYKDQTPEKIKSPTKSEPSKVINVNKPKTLQKVRPKVKPKTPSVLSKFLSPKKRPIAKSIQNSLDRKMNIMTNQNRSFTGSSSHSMLNLINKFKDRKSDSLSTKPPINVQTKLQPPPSALENLLTRDYDSRDIPKELSPPPKIELPKPNTGPILRPINSYRPDFNPRKLNAGIRSTLNPPQYNKPQINMPSLQSGVRLPNLVAAPNAEISQPNLSLTNQIPNLDSSASNIFIAIDNSLINSHQQLLDNSMPQNYLQIKDSFSTQLPIPQPQINNQLHEHNSVLLNNYFASSTPRLSSPMQPRSNLFGGNQIHQLAGNRSSLIDSQMLNPNRPPSINQQEFVSYIQNFSNSPAALANPVFPKRMQLSEALQSRIQQNAVIAMHQNNPVIVYQNAAPQAAPQYQYVINTPNFNAVSEVQQQQQQQTFYSQQSMSSVNPNARFVVPKLNAYGIQGELNPQLMQQSQAPF